LSETDVYYEEKSRLDPENAVLIVLTIDDRLEPILINNCDNGTKPAQFLEVSPSLNVYNELKTAHSVY